MQSTILPQSITWRYTSCLFSPLTRSRYPENPQRQPVVLLISENYNHLNNQCWWSLEQGKETKWRENSTNVVVRLNISNIDKETSIKDSWFYKCIVRPSDGVAGWYCMACNSGLYLKWENRRERNLLPSTQNRQNRNSLTLSVQWFLSIFNISIINATQYFWYLK